MTSERPEQTDVDVSGFAAVINSRLAAEARIAKAMGLVWLGAGAAIACCLTGLGVLAALYGYSYMISVRPAAEQTAKAFVLALERAQIKTTVAGTMSLAQNSEVKLAPGQTVKLEDGAIVKLDPNSSVRVTAIDVPQPSNQQLGLGIKANNDELPFTSYTIFRNVPYGSGAVVTGWNYDLKDRTRPKAQHCYYTLSVEKGLSAKYTIGFDGAPQRSSPLDAVDFDGAFANCTWFAGS